MPKQITEQDIELLDELGVDSTSQPIPARTRKEQRIIAGFEDIERFVEEHCRLPQHGEERDIFERLYAVRLDRIRASAECRGILADRDPRGLLGEAGDADVSRVEESPDDEALLASLGVDESVGADVGELVHVRSREEIKAAEEIARRNPCADFALFKPMFATIQQQLDTGSRRTVKYQDNAEVNQGDWFILDGQKVFVAEMGEVFVTDYGRPDRRLRVIYDNGTESDLLVRSLQRALNKDKTSRRITQPDLGPLFSDVEEAGDVKSGCIYVLRSRSEHPFIAKHRDTIHKIGVTGGDVKRRIANAKKDPTYLLAEVDIVATFKLANINRNRLESLLHTFFAAARLEVGLLDRFGEQVEPREWYILPLSAIEEAVEKLKAGTLVNYRYDAGNARLIELAD